jgi:hypothetical protein
MCRSRCLGGSRLICQGVTSKSGERRPGSEMTEPDIDLPMDFRLITLYQHVYDGIHAKSGGVTSFKQIYIKTEHEACMGWVSP